MEIGGKKGFIHNVTGRKGLPNTAKVEMNEPGSDSSFGKPAGLQLNLEVGAFALPHPFKSEKGAANNRRDFGAYELSEDLEYCEDAHFAIRLRDMPSANPLDVISSHIECASEGKASPTSTSEISPATPPTTTNSSNSQDFHLPLSVVPEPSQIFLCVADGVGSWRQFNIDPRDDK